MRRPIEDGLFIDSEDGSEAHLIGSKCPLCGLVTFPKFWLCPRCRDRTVAPVIVALSGRGVLDRYCVAERGPRVFSPPYVQSYIRLEEGPLVYSLVRGVNPRDPGLSRGQPMIVKIDVLRTDEKGDDVIGWTARPAGGPEE
jgi:uncharacterized OB-fold protein